MTERNEIPKKTSIFESDKGTKCNGGTLRGYVLIYIIHSQVESTTLLLLSCRFGVCVLWPCRSEYFEMSSIFNLLG